MRIHWLSSSQYPCNPEQHRFLPCPHFFFQSRLSVLEIGRARKIGEAAGRALRLRRQRPAGETSSEPHDHGSPPEITDQYVCLQDARPPFGGTNMRQVNALGEATQGLSELPASSALPSHPVRPCKGWRFFAACVKLVKKREANRRLIEHFGISSLPSLAIIRPSFFRAPFLLHLLKSEAGWSHEHTLFCFQCPRGHDSTNVSVAKVVVENMHVLIIQKEAIEIARNRERTCQRCPHQLA